MKQLICFLLLFYSIGLFANNESSFDDSKSPSIGAPYTGTPVFSEKKSPIKNALSKIDQTKLEEILNQEMNRLRSEEIDFITVDSLNDDVSNGSIGQLLAGEIEAIGRARAIINKLKSTGNFLLQFTGDDLISLPVGIQQEIGNVTYTMGIGSMKLKSTHAELEIYLEIDVPGRAPLYFGAPNIKFTKNGGIVGDGCLGLLADFVVDITKHKSVLKLNKARLNNETGSCVGGTYVNIDCDGFKELSIEAEVIFSRDWLKPANDLGTNRVTGSFDLAVSSWEDILFTIDMEDFTLNRLEDITFRVDSMVFDFSDTRLAEEINYPDGYVHPLMDTPLWKGFYIQQFRVELPPRLTGGVPKTIDAENIIIDNTGFSGRVGVYPGIIPLNEGNLEGWAFSLDTFRLEMMQNQFQEVSFTGMINVPIFSSGNNNGATINEADCFGYRALINPGNVYAFTIANGEEYNVNMWQATAQIEPNSTVDIVYENGVFTTTATLHGELNIAGDDDGNGFSVDIPTIPFDSLKISNKPDYFEPGTWGIPTGGNASLGNFDLTVSTITITQPTDKTAAVDFNVLVNLTSNALALTASGGIQIVGTHATTDNGRHRWELEDVDINSIYVEGDFHGVNSIRGQLNFYEEDQAFGTGFYGAVQVDFRGIGAEIAAVAQFGSIDDVPDPYRYFMVDAKVDFGDGGIDLGGIRIKGFGGGIYRHMSRPSSDLAWNQFTGPGNFDENSPPPIGTSMSGIQYTPTDAIRLGLEATVILASSGSDRSFNGNVTFGMEFGGEGEEINLQRVWFQGNARFMDDIQWNQAPTFVNDDTQVPENASMVSAFVMIDYSIAEQILHANLAVHVNVNNTIVGSGWAEFYFNKPDDLWYMKIGQPIVPGSNDDRGPIQVEINIPLIDVSLGATAYLMMGNTEIPEIPPIDLPGFDGYNPPPRDTEAQSTGQGLAFGVSLNLEGDLRFLFLYAKLGAGLGFDIALLNYGETACANTGNTIGVNGWYASGQAWAYFTGEMGLTAKVFGKRRHFTLVEAAAAVILEAKGPNPFWGRGTFLVEWDLLGGLIEGEEDFEIELGEKCDYIVDQEYKLVATIKELRPQDGTTNFGVEEYLEAEFLIPIGVEYEVADLEGDGTEPVLIRAMLGDVWLRRGSIPISIEEVEMDYTKKNITIKPKRFLPANTQITYIQRVYFQEKVNGVWVDVEEEGEVVYEADTVSFTTGNALTEIPTANVYNAYPIDRMLNFYKENTPGGYVILERDQQQLFTCIPEGYQTCARFSDMNDNQVAEVPAFYEGWLGGLRYSIPHYALENATIYKLELVIKPGENTTDGGSTTDGGPVSNDGGKPGTHTGNDGSGSTVAGSLTYPSVNGFIEQVYNDGNLGIVTVDGLVQQIMSATGATDYNVVYAMVEQQLKEMKSYYVQETTRTQIASINLTGASQQTDEITAQIMQLTALNKDMSLVKPIVSTEVDLKLTTEVYDATIQVLQGIQVVGTDAEISEYTTKVKNNTDLIERDQLIETVVRNEITKIALNGGSLDDMQGMIGNGGVNTIELADGTIIVLGEWPPAEPQCFEELPTAEEFGPERITYTAHFRTSNYNTFEEKMASFTLGTPVYQSGHNLVADLEGGDEGFDYFEINGFSEDISVITGSADLSNPWYESQIYNLLYNPNLFPCEMPIPQQNSIFKFRRDSEDEYGVPLLAAGSLEQANPLLKLTDANIENNQFDGFGSFIPQVHYSVGKVASLDFLSYKQQGWTAAGHIGSPGGTSVMIPLQIRTIMHMENFPELTSGKYNVDIKYRYGATEVNFGLNK